jgi:hypothetical protein
MQELLDIIHAAKSGGVYGFFKIEGYDGYSIADNNGQPIIIADTNTPDDEILANFRSEIEAAPLPPEVIDFFTIEFETADANEYAEEF